jgi:WD40 repeat protein
VLASIKLNGAGACVRMSPVDPAIVFVGGEGGLLKWNTTTGARTPLQGHKDVVSGLCLSEAGTALASCSDDSSVRLWDTNTGRCVWVSEQPNCVFSVAMCGDMVFCGTDGSNTVGLRKSDGMAGPTYAQAGGTTYGLVVTRGEHVVFSQE